MTSLQSCVFHTVGTNANSYLARFFKKYLFYKSFYINKVDKETEIYYENKQIDFFTSYSTFKQFINTLISFGMIKKGVGNFIIISKEFNINKIKETIFQKNNDKKINILRQSRLISFLVYINYINENNFSTYQIKGKIKLAKYENIKSEISNWEKQVVQNPKLMIEVLKRMEHYDFTKN